MSLFDTLVFEYPLPDPPDAQELTGFNFNSLSYQTKDLDEAMADFKVDKEGVLWKKFLEFKWHVGDKK